MFLLLVSPTKYQNSWPSLCMHARMTRILKTLQICGSVKLDTKIADAQHTRGINCGCDSIAKECLCLPHANWQTWNITTSVVKREVKGRRARHILCLVDDDETILHFIKRTEGDEAKAHSDYGVTLKSGWREDVPEDVEKSVMEKFTKRNLIYTTALYCARYLSCYCHTCHVHIANV